jgi:hypothetical protein
MDRIEGRSEMKYWKILNESECHNGLKYKTGLNTLLPHEQWNPSGDCEPGGIYYAGADILAFVSYGPWVREVTIPDDARTYKNPDSPEKWKADKVILGRRRKWTNPTVLEGLIADGAYVHACGDYALRWASRNGHLAVVKLLLKHGAAVHADGDYALRWASGNGHLEVLELLLKHGAYVHADDDAALRWASENGHLEVVKLLKEHMGNEGK